MMRAVSIFIAGLSFAISAHATDTISGELTVTEGSLRVKRLDGKKVHFYQGQYPAKLELIGAGSKGRLWIGRNGITTRARFRIPGPVPANGEFMFSAEELGQTFAVKGQVRTKKTESPLRYDYERCTYTERRYVCRYERGRRVCYWEQVSYPGEREVEFYFRTISRRLDVILSSGHDVTFAGQSRKSSKIYTYRGACR